MLKLWIQFPTRFGLMEIDYFQIYAVLKMPAIESDRGEIIRIYIPGDPVGIEVNMTFQQWQELKAKIDVQLNLIRK